MAVVIPCWNDGAFLREAVASARSQGEPCELVVVDDGSTDAATLRVLDGLRADGVTVVRQDNAGVSAARMLGVASTTAPFVLPLDADDRLAEGAVAMLADALAAHPQAAAAWGDTRAFGSFDWVFPSWPTLDPWLVTYVNRLTVACLYRRSALAEVGGWTHADGYEDWDLWLALAARGWSGVHCGGVHLEYRQHESPRGLDRHRARHEQTMRSLRRRHRELFAARRHTAALSAAPRRVRVAFRLVDAVPRLTESRRHRLHDVALRTLMPATRPIVHGVPQPGPLRVLGRRLTGRR